MFVVLSAYCFLCIPSRSPLKDYSGIFLGKDGEDEMLAGWSGMFPSFLAVKIIHIHASLGARWTSQVK